MPSKESKSDRANRSFRFHRGHGATFSSVAGDVRADSCLAQVAGLRRHWESGGGLIRVCVNQEIMKS